MKVIFLRRSAEIPRYIHLGTHSSGFYTKAAKSRIRLYRRGNRILSGAIRPRRKTATIAFAIVEYDVTQHLILRYFDVTQHNAQQRLSRQVKSKSCVAVFRNATFRTAHLEVLDCYFFIFFAKLLLKTCISFCKHNADPAVCTQFLDNVSCKLQEMQTIII